MTDRCEEGQRLVRQWLSDYREVQHTDGWREVFNRPWCRCAQCQRHELEAFAARWGVSVPELEEA